MTWYTFFKSVHVLCAIVWVGGAVLIQLLALRALAGDGRRQAEFAKDAEVVGMRVFLPASVLLLLSGIAAVVNGDWSWGQNWVAFGLLVIVASAAAGAGFMGPESGRLAALIAAKGPDAPEVTARIHRILTVSRIELVLLVAVVWNMVVKPVGQPGWFWGAIAVTALAVVAVVAAYRRQGPVPESAPVAE